MVRDLLPQNKHVLFPLAAGWHLFNSALFSCYSVWISYLDLSYHAIGQSNFIYQPMRTTHIHRVQKDYPTVWTLSQISLGTKRETNHCKCPSMFKIPCGAWWRISLIPALGRRRQEGWVQAWFTYWAPGQKEKDWKRRVKGSVVLSGLCCGQAR